MNPVQQLPRIEAGPLLLRPPGVRDIESLSTLADDIDIARMTTRLPHPYRRADAEAFVTRARTLDPASEAVFVIEKHDAGAVGVLGLRQHGGFGPEIGYWIGRPFWGQGLASRAACAAMDWAGQDWRRRIVVAGYFADNPASGRVLERAGFLHTGEIQHRHSLARGGTAPTRMMVWLA